MIEAMFATFLERAANPPLQSHKEIFI
jgi:hypothetical protein